jgi:uncharacterized peroxidase-related enzyme
LEAFADARQTSRPYGAVFAGEAYSSLCTTRQSSTVIRAQSLPLNALTGVSPPMTAAMRGLHPIRRGHITIRVSAIMRRPVMNPFPISRFPIAGLAGLPDDIRERILAVQEKSGFVPNVFLAFAHRPDEFRAFFAYHDALMEKEGGLSKAEREMIVVATSGAAQCQYCVVAHGAILRIRAKSPLLADQVAINYRKADITPRQRAMLDFAMKISTAQHAVDDADFAVLKEHGFSQDDIWDIGAIAAFFALSNRMANMMSLRPNDEFFLLGRVPKS